MKAEELINYKDYVKSEYWTARKRQYYEKHPHKCEVCGHPDVDLHHLKYGEYGHEADKNLAALCRVHHEELHQAIPLRKNMHYHSRYVIEEMKKAWEAHLNAPIVPSTPPAPQTVIRLPNFIEVTATRIQKVLDRFFAA